MKILHLTLTKKWFGLIASGEKTVEYREYKDHWISRLMVDGCLRQDYTEIHFKNGYGKDAPFMRVELSHITLYRSDFIFPQHGEEITAQKYFLICLGKVLELRA